MIANTNLCLSNIGFFFEQRRQTTAIVAIVTTAITDMPIAIPTVSLEEEESVPFLVALCALISK